MSNVPAIMSRPRISSSRVCETSAVTAHEITVPRASDFHVHLRQDELMHLVTPRTRRGGVGRVLVMPNTNPVIDTALAATEYRAKLRHMESGIDYLMTLFLNENVTPAEVTAAAKAGVVGIKSYPRGVTTNSSGGIENYEKYFPTFRAMEEHGMVLNLHGEVPVDHDNNICIMNAEEHFLTHLEKINKAFPRLRIVLEHVTTKAAVEKVKSLSDTVAATITAHHLDLVVDHWAGKPHNYCKPVAKYPSDREALRDVVRSGNPRFFLGSDSAPHLRGAKESSCGCAGVYTGAYIMPYLATTFEQLGCLDQLANFTSGFGNKFYHLTPLQETITLRRGSFAVPHAIRVSGPFIPENELVPYRAGEQLAWSLVGEEGLIAQELQASGTAMRPLGSGDMSHSLLMSMPKRNRRAKFSEPNSMLRDRRLNPALSHTPRKTISVTSNATQGQGPRGGQHACVDCALCCSYKTNNDGNNTGKRQRVGSKTSTMCSVCEVGLCMRAKPGGGRNCWELWHTEETLGAPEAYQK